MYRDISLHGCLLIKYAAKDEKLFHIKTVSCLDTTVFPYRERISLA